MRSLRILNSLGVISASVSWPSVICKLWLYYFKKIQYLKIVIYQIHGGEKIVTICTMKRLWLTTRCLTISANRELLPRERFAL